MIDLKGYEVKTKGFGVLRCRYLYGNKLFVEYNMTLLKGRNSWRKGYVNLSVSTKDVIQSEYGWPVISKEAVPRLTFSDVVDDKGQTMFDWVQRAMNNYESKVSKMVDMNISFTSDDRIRRILNDAEYYINMNLSSWGLKLIDDYNSRAVSVLNSNQIATICNLIEVSCGKSKVSQSFKSVGLELKLEYDPDNLTGAIKVLDGRTVEEAILDSLNHTA